MLFIVGIVCTMAAFGFNALAKRQRWERAAAFVLGQIQEARMQAMSQNVAVTLDYNAAAGTFTREGDLNGDGTITSDEQHIQTMAGVTGVTVTWPADPIEFTASGRLPSGVAATQVRIQSASGDTTIEVSPSGLIK